MSSRRFKACRSIAVEEEFQNVLCSNVLPIFWWKSKKCWIFFPCFFESNIQFAAWVWAEWTLINSYEWPFLKYCTCSWLVRPLDATFFRAWEDFIASQHLFMKQEFDLNDSKIGFLYATMNGWVQNWVQGEMCCNNTIKLEWYISVVLFSLCNVSFKE